MKDMGFRRRLLRAASAVSVMAAIAVPATGALAQSSDGQAADAAQDNSTDIGLGEIVVTAQRRSESMQRVPIAVSAMNAQALETIGFTKPGDVVAVVPSVQVQEIYGKFQPIFSIRGISQSSYTANQSSPVGVYADEAYIGETYLHGSNFFDIERVEVLKGPQGTLYGKNTTGGAINLISRTPKIDDGVHGNLTLGYGNYKAVNIEGGAEATLVPGALAVRVAGFYNDDEGYQRIVNLGIRAGDTHTWGIRGTAVFEPVSDLEFVLRYTHSETDQFPNQPRAIGAYPTGPGGSLQDISGYGRPASLGYRDFESNEPGQHVRIRYDLLSLATTLRLPAFDLVSHTSYHSSRKRMVVDIDGGLGAVAGQGFNNDTKAFSQDLRLVTTGSDDLKFIVGGYYGYERNAQVNTFLIYRSPLNGLIDYFTPVLGAEVANYYADFYGQFGMTSLNQTLNHRSLAAYGEANWQATPQFGVTVGLRYTHDKDGQIYYNISRYAGRNADFTPSGPVGSYIPGNITADTDNPLDSAFDLEMTHMLSGPFTTDSAPLLYVTTNRLTGKITLDYKPTDQTMIYATFSRGYRSGNFNGGVHYLFQRSGPGAYAQPETVNAYELGVKSEFFDRRARFNAAVFQYDYKNQQFEDVQGISTVLASAGKARLRGVEAELVIAAVRDLTLSFNGLYLDSEYKQIALKGTDLAGNSLISAPKWSGTVSADYQAALTSDVTAFFHVDASYRSRQWYSAFNAKNGYGNIGQPKYGLVNGRVGVRADAGYELAFWVKNLFDRKYVSYAINIQDAYAMDYLMDGPPRTYGVELSYKF